MRHLTKAQRYVIQTLHRRGISKKEIAKELGVHKSTISREIKRNRTKTGRYNAEIADMYANERKERFANKRKFTPSVKKNIDKHIREEQWSPEQIVGYCKKKNVEMVSIERIYQYIREDKANGGDLYKHLRHKLKHRKRTLDKNDVRIKDKISIEQRPKSVNTREEFGHFEMDLIVGKDNNGAILTITERKTRQFFCRYLPQGKIAKGVSKAVTQELIPFKKHVLSITTDNGSEFADHKTIAEKLNTTVYFTHPYSSWEKGQIEYCNKLLRQYIPKKTIINNNNILNLNEIQMKINNRPRKNLNYDKPFELFYKFVNR